MFMLIDIILALFVGFVFGIYMMMYESKPKLNRQVLVNGKPFRFARFN